MIDFYKDYSSLLSGLGVTASENSINAIEADDYFPLAYKKYEEVLYKQQVFKGARFEKIFVVTHPSNYVNFASSIDGDLINPISEDLIRSANQFRERLSKELHRALVILTNNNGANIGYENLVAIKNLCPETVFALHDFDNHHWVRNSTILAAICDVYIPAHIGDYSFVGRINSQIVSGIPCGSIQWSKEFLEKNSSTLFRSSRQIGPLGKHHLYERFTYRNRILATLSKKYESIGFTVGRYHEKTQVEKWQEWTAYKLHFICPVWNDLPIRFFDALISGGMPLVPMSLRPYLDSLSIPSKHYYLYSPSDILHPERLVTAGCNRFDELGNDGIIERHSYALREFNVDTTLKRIIRGCKDLYTPTYSS